MQNWSFFTRIISGCYVFVTRGGEFSRSIFVSNRIMDVYLMRSFHYNSITSLFEVFQSLNTESLVFGLSPICHNTTNFWPHAKGSVVSFIHGCLKRTRLLYQRWPCIFWIVLTLALNRCLGHGISAPGPDNFVMGWINTFAFMIVCCLEVTTILLQ